MTSFGREYNISMKYVKWCMGYMLPFMFFGKLNFIVD